MRKRSFAASNGPSAASSAYPATTRPRIGPDDILVLRRIQAGDQRGQQGQPYSERCGVIGKESLPFHGPVARRYLPHAKHPRDR
jgi:hypothetical protein